MPKDEQDTKTTKESNTNTEKQDDTPPLKKTTTWQALVGSIILNILYLSIFAVLVGNFIYFKTLNFDQLDYFFPTMSDNASRQSGGGKLFCDDYPANWMPKWTAKDAESILRGPLWDARWPTNEQYNTWSNTEEGYFWGIGFTSWLKLTTIKSYNTLRGWLKAFLSSGFNKSTPSIFNNMFFQSILFGIMCILSGFLSVIVTFVHSVISDPWWGLLFGWIPFLVCIPILQTVQLFGTFPTFPIWPGFGILADSKLSSLKTMKKIFECNIPTLIFLFALNIIITFGGVAGGGVAIGMWVWFIYASTRGKKK